jgi:hypothetical protein
VPTAEELRQAMTELGEAGSSTAQGGAA